MYKQQEVIKFGLSENKRNLEKFSGITIKYVQNLATTLEVV